MLIEKMKLLLADPTKASKLGKGAREAAMQCFNIERFKKDWLMAFEKAISIATGLSHELYSFLHTSP